LHNVLPNCRVARELEVIRARVRHHEKQSAMVRWHKKTRVMTRQTRRGGQSYSRGKN
jgi:hypothetical protein